jgi:hypothetical protein
MRLDVRGHPAAPVDDMLEHITRLRGYGTTAT